MMRLATGAGGYLKMFRDRTTEYESAARRQESETRLRLAVDHAEIGLWDVDLVRDELIWPPRTKAMFGISPDVPVSMADFYAGLHPEERDSTSQSFAAAADPARRWLYDVEYRTIGKEDGLIRWVAAKGARRVRRAGRNGPVRAGDRHRHRHLLAQAGRGRAAGTERTPGAARHLAHGRAAPLSQHRRCHRLADLRLRPGFPPDRPSTRRITTRSGASTASTPSSATCSPTSSSQSSGRSCAR